MLNTLTLSSKNILRGFVRYPLKFVPRTMVVPVLMGSLRGTRWIVGSAIHRCWLGFYEYEKQRLVAREVQPHTVFYDLGAHVGFYSLLASQLVGNGRVFAFEPVPNNVSYLKRHLALNQVENVEVLELAVSDENSFAQFELEETSFMGQLSSKGGLSVRTATLDSLINEGMILPPDYIKMDIEGTELLALRGAKESIQRYRPVIFLATHGTAVHDGCCRLLESWGYDYRVLQSNSSDTLREVIAKFRSH